MRWKVNSIDRIDMEACGAVFHLSCEMEELDSDEVEVEAYFSPKALMQLPLTKFGFRL